MDIYPNPTVSESEISSCNDDELVLDEISDSVNELIFLFEEVVSNNSQSIECVIPITKCAPNDFERPDPISDEVYENVIKAVGSGAKFENLVRLYTDLVWDSNLKRLSYKTALDNNWNLRDNEQATYRSKLLEQIDACNERMDHFRRTQTLSFSLVTLFVKDAKRRKLLLKKYTGRLTKQEEREIETMLACKRRDDRMATLKDENRNLRAEIAKKDNLLNEKDLKIADLESRVAAFKLESEKQIAHQNFTTKQLQTILDFIESPSDESECGNQLGKCLENSRTLITFVGNPVNCFTGGTGANPVHDKVLSILKDSKQANLDDAKPDNALEKKIKEPLVSTSTSTSTATSTSTTKTTTTLKNNAHQTLKPSTPSLILIGFLFVFNYYY